MRLLTSQYFFLTLITASLICSIIFQYLYPLFFLFFFFVFHLLFLILLALRHNLATIFKGPLRYKMIVSQNVSCEGFRKAIFLTIPKFTKSVTSWWGLVQETGCIFQYIFWTTTFSVTKLDQLIDISKSNTFTNSLDNLEDWC